MFVLTRKTMGALKPEIRSHASVRKLEDRHYKERKKFPWFPLLELFFLTAQCKITIVNISTYSFTTNVILSH